MGHGHSHGSHAVVEVGQRARTYLLGLLAVFGVLAIAGMIWLWPSSTELDAALTKVVDAPASATPMPPSSPSPRAASRLSRRRRERPPA
ncbi:hypothetical protein G7085_11580 [Tessaracoccus sp. HDW20]|uniref:hypothetical protein n=1 Tax=Tessaracoccus coleopterorum TaxID=2714950 RepID=UPI0018D2D250|nr:hypothetical protein [Tessaracoccus coleopterorum]NHB85029.1 hypothetical protein [Tessaracoccus coleopterorum]